MASSLNRDLSPVEPRKPPSPDTKANKFAKQIIQEKMQRDYYQGNERFLM
jgi:hypothetical protein